jgi:hypothetical protein
MGEACPAAAALGGERGRSGRADAAGWCGFLTAGTIR